MAERFDGADGVVQRAERKPGIAKMEEEFLILLGADFTGLPPAAAFHRPFDIANGFLGMLPCAVLGEHGDAEILDMLRHGFR